VVVGCLEVVVGWVFRGGYGVVIGCLEVVIGCLLMV